MPSRKKQSPVIAIEYFKEAVAYQISADRLYEQIDSQTLKKTAGRENLDTGISGVSA